MKQGTTGESYNCASGIKVSIQDLAESVLKILDKTNIDIEYADWKIGDIKYFDVSNQKLKDLGMEWNTSFEDGLHQTLDWSKNWFTSQK